MPDPIDQSVPPRSQSDAPAGTPPLDRARRTPLLVKVLLGIIGGFVLLVAGFVGVEHVWSRVYIARARTDSAKILRRASTDEELKDAAGRLGVVLRVKDGSWIAIRYRDSHGLPFWSSAVARCSDGSWYENDYHFCGTFSFYTQARDQIASGEYSEDFVRGTQDHLASGPTTSACQKIESSNDFATAKGHLEGLGFTQWKPPSE